MRRTAACLSAIVLASLVGACAQTTEDTVLPPPKKDGGTLDTGAPPPEDTGSEVDNDTGTAETTPPSDSSETCATPGDIQKRACGKCGKQLRTCGAAGLWNPWKACEDEIADAECSISETRTNDCGNCGKQTDTCDPVACTWVSGTCAKEGPCAPGDIEKTSASCTVAGEVRKRTCDDKCMWSSFTACGLPTGWTKMDPPPTTLAGRAYPSAVWTGTEAIFWGGYFYATPYTYSKADGGAFSLAGGSGGSWGVLPAPPSTLSAGRYLHSAVYTSGKKMILWGGVSSSSTVNNTGVVYDTSLKTWGSAMSTTGAPSARAGAGAVWAEVGTYKEMIIWGGCTAGVGIGGSSCSTYAADGFSYDPATDKWTALPPPPPGFAGRWKHTMVWSGTEVIIFGGQTTGSGFAKDIARYDPVTRVWTKPSDPLFDGRYDGAGVWSGKELIAWGGYGSYLGSSYGRDDGARYLPGGGWSTMAVTTLTSPKRWGMEAWWDTKMKRLYVWGGFNGTGTISTGGSSYDPTLDKWYDMDSTGTDVPSGRAHAGLVWTGKEAIMYGGRKANYYYDSTWYNETYLYRE